MGASTASHYCHLPYNMRHYSSEEFLVLNLIFEQVRTVPQKFKCKENHSLGIQGLISQLSHRRVKTLSHLSLPSRRLEIKRIVHNTLGYAMAGHPASFTVLIAQGGMNVGS
jgi:hypothetical protein